MSHVTGYRVQVTHAPDASEERVSFHLTLPQLDPLRFSARVTPVLIHLESGVQLAESGSGDWLFYRVERPYGKSLMEAISCGWVWVQDLPEPVEPNGALVALAAPAACLYPSSRVLRCDAR